MYLLCAPKKVFTQIHYTSGEPELLLQPMERGNSVAEPLKGIVNF